MRVEDCDDFTFRKIAPLLRAEDQDEWRAFTGYDAPGLIARGYKLPAGAGTINRFGYDELTGSPLAVWGVSPIPASPGCGWVWLVATPEATRVAIGMHRNLRSELDLLMRDYQRLKTAAWVGNPVHLKWLDWLGFKLDGSQFVGRQFIPYQYEQQDKR